MASWRMPVELVCFSDRLHHRCGRGSWTVRRMGGPKWSIVVAVLRFVVAPLGPRGRRALFHPNWRGVVSTASRETIWRLHVVLLQDASGAMKKATRRRSAGAFVAVVIARLGLVRPQERLRPQWRLLSRLGRDVLPRVARLRRRRARRTRDLHGRPQLARVGGGRPSVLRHRRRWRRVRGLLMISWLSPALRTLMRRSVALGWPWWLLSAATVRRSRSIRFGSTLFRVMAFLLNGSQFMRTRRKISLWFL